MTTVFDSAYFRALPQKLAATRLIDASREPHRLAELAGFCAPAFIELMAKGYRGFAEASLAEIARRAPLDNLQHLPPRNRDAAHTLLRRAKLVFDPFSGGWTETTRCLGREAYWIDADAGGGCVIGQYGCAFSPCCDTTYLFPDSALAVFFGETALAGDITREAGELFANLAAAPDAAARIAARSAPPRLVGAAEMKAPHFGHYVWNALSGWGSLIPALAERIDLFVGWRENNFFAPVTEIFPALRDRPLDLVASDAELLRLIDTREALLCFPKGDHLDENLARTVAAWALRACPPERLDALRHLRARVRPLCVLALRLGNRMWLEQRDGLVALARSLHARHPDIGFLLDGLSAGKTMGWTHALMSVEAERTLARAIAADIAAFAPCLNLVGGAMEESLVGIDLCDFFVAPAGSGLAKLKWLSNRPGVVISNRTALDRDNAEGWAVRVFDGHRDRARPSCTVAWQDVADVPAPERPERIHDNFHLDWRRIDDVLAAKEDEWAIAG